MSPTLTLPTPASFFASEPFAHYTVATVPFPPHAVFIFGLVVLAVAALFSLAIVYHWLSYGRYPLFSFITLGVFAIGFFFFAGLVVASGIF